MLVSSDYSRVRVAARRGVPEKFPGRVLLEVDCYDTGHHGYGDIPEEPAGDPLHGSASWRIMDVDEEYDLPELEGLVGKPVQIWTGDWWGSYHERHITVFLVAPGIPPGPGDEAKSPKLEGEFIFRNLRTSCEELIERLGLGDPPYPEDLPKLDVDPHLLDRQREGPGEGNQGNKERLKVETPYRSKPGETSQQYWNRLRDEETGKYHYKHPGD
jgi:hypothetical protein